MNARNGLGLAALIAGAILHRRHTVVTSVKSVDSVITGYRDDLTRDFLDVLDAKISLPEAERRHMRYLRRDAEPAYVEGLAAGDVEAGEMDADDRKAINDWLGEQAGYVPGLWQAVGDLRKRLRGMDPRWYEEGQRDIADRIGLWAGALRDLASQGKASALANMSVTWHLGATEKHCRVCNRLNGSKHRLKWFTGRGYLPQENGSEVLDCGGWQCLCTLRDGKGKVILPA